MPFPATFRLLALTLLPAFSAAAQAIVSARSGVVNVAEGAVFIADSPVEQKAGKFPEIQEGADLRTEIGRAEILLTPGVILRVGQNSTITLLSANLSDTRLQLRTGSVTIDVAEQPENTSVTLLFNGYAMHFPNRGIFRLDTSPALFEAFEGSADLTFHGETRSIGKGHMAELSGGLVSETFRPQLGDSLYEWTMRRSDKLALENTPPADPASGYLPGFDIYNDPLLGLSPYYPQTGAYGYGNQGYGYLSPFGVYSLFNNSYPPVYRYGIYSPRSPGTYGYRGPSVPTFGRAGGVGAARPSMPTFSAAPRSPGRGFGPSLGDASRSRALPVGFQTLGAQTSGWRLRNR